MKYINRGLLPPRSSQFSKAEEGSLFVVVYQVYHTFSGTHAVQPARKAEESNLFVVVVDRTIPYRAIEVSHAAIKDEFR